MLFKKKYEPWYKKSPMAKLSFCHAALRKCKQDDTGEIPVLFYLHARTSKSFILLKLFYYSRYLAAVILNTGIFFASFLYLSPPAEPEFITSLGLLFIPIGAIFLASALGIYLQGLIDDVEVRIDGLVHDIDEHILPNHGFRTFDDDIY